MFLQQIFLVFVLTSNVLAIKKYNTIANETSVSGLSSGAFFANQIQVAHSSIIKGAGIIAGGPYDCGGQALYAMCMYMNSPSVQLSIMRTNEWSGRSIDEKSNLKRQKVYMISGTKDMTVSTSVMDQLYRYLVTDSGFISAENIVYKKDLTSGHTFPTDFEGIGNNECSTSQSPYVSNCGFDSAGAILNHIYGKLNPRNDGQLSGQWLEFDQSKFITFGLDIKGFMFVPKACADGHKCRLHIAFHGCQQSHSQISDKFIKNTGYDKWADNNNIIVIFPQTYPDYGLHLTPTHFWLNNLNACWDWIGWYGADFPTKNGVQVKFIKNIIDKISSY